MANACKSYTTIVSIAKSSPIMFSAVIARPDPEYNRDCRCVAGRILMRKRPFDEVRARQTRTTYKVI